ncbi:hypothetical protein [Methylobacterium bullatum]|uniref:Beta-ketoacyl synthase N-terminal domain-containing protein n=1 Tax=Methylobacterium bullatum TaxID=570505 RepID=A0AAV4Z8W2_9HYPH|nr:hypothetical protein [Methylobacterium bullatum]GJD40331.1 hypothetical protein OICFNHDK_2799 [Methylobacterium bullatum]
MTLLTGQVIDVSQVLADGKPQLASEASEITWNPTPPFRGQVFDDEHWKTARKLGMARARSSSPAAWLAVSAASAVKSHLVDQRVAVSVVSTTLTEAVAFRFERTGLQQGWKLTDPFWLPNTIPSSSATAIVATLQLKGSAIAFPGSLQGFFAALDRSLLALSNCACERALLVVAEENSWLTGELSARGGAAVTRGGAFAVVLGPAGERRAIIERDAAPLFGPATEGSNDVSGLNAKPYEADAVANLMFAFKAGAFAVPPTSRAFEFVSGRERFKVKLRQMG